MPQETNNKNSPSSSSESNSRKAYLSKQFEDHTKNFILKAQERFELQAEKRKQHAKTKKAYSTVNKLPASSSSTSTSGSTNLMSEGTSSLFKLPTWLLRSSARASNDLSDNLKSTRRHQQPLLRRFKRQGESGLNLDSLLDFVKEQTAKLDQVNNQLKSLANSVSQGLDKLRKAANESFIDLQESASQVSREVRTALDTFNSGPKQGETLSDFTSKVVSSVTRESSNDDGEGKSLVAVNSDHQPGAEAIDDIRRRANNAYQQIQSAWSNLAERVSQATSDQITLLNSSDGKSSESVYSAQG